MINKLYKQILSLLINDNTLFITFITTKNNNFISNTEN